MVFRKLKYKSPQSITIPSSIWALGSVSFLMKVSSVVVFILSPFFITQVLGVSTFVLGILDGVVEAISLFTRIFAGVLSDFVHKRKIIIVVGYFFALVSRPLLALSSTITTLLVGRAFDRVGNGLDATPRDALVGDIAPSEIKGACYGLRESLSRAGAFAGALITVGLLWYTGNNYSIIFWLGAIPIALALIVLLIFVKDPVSDSFQKKHKAKALTFKDITDLPLSFWLTLLLSGLFMISNFSGSFLLLRAEQTGLHMYLVPLVMVIQNLATAGIAYPVGYLSDKIGRNSMMALGIGLVVLSDILLANATSIYVVLGGVFLWGAEIGVTQSILAILIADSCPKEVRGTGFGLFHFVNGLCLLVANTLAGFVWDTFSPSATFYVSAVIAALSALVLPLLRRK